jgi:hypothetical protein
MSKFYSFHGVSNLTLVGGNGNISGIRKVDGRFFIYQQNDYYYEVKIPDYSRDYLGNSIPFRSICVAQNYESVSIILEEFLLCVLGMIDKNLPLHKYSQAKDFPLSEFFLANQKEKFYYDNKTCKRIYDTLLTCESLFSECSDDLLFASNKKLCYSRIKDIFALAAANGMVWLERE